MLIRNLHWAKKWISGWVPAICHAQQFDHSVFHFLQFNQMGHKVLIFLVSNKQIQCHSGLLLFYLLKGKSKKKLCFCLGQRWHPDRCSASENSRFVDEAKKKFQTIQQAYSVLSDTNKRFLYDIGVYDSEDDENGMGGFLNEMAVMMSQTKPHENVEESFEELQGLFEEMFQEDLDSFGIGRPATTCVSYSESSNSNDKRVSVDMNLKKTKVDDSSGFNSHVEKFCLGVEHQQSFKKGKGVRGGVQGGTGAGRGRKGRKQEFSSGNDVSSHDHGISAS